ncbi:anti-sigma factor family protein [Streptomyces sp. NPDC020412]|uniref:anti-sigma factor family protein n=1 Tax=Streptomyces sp. NPDC020412 TaxID=3365073 RepID=UPI003789A5DB
MSGSSPISPTPAEQHLGDRLAALVDGELKHDARDRVLAHLATCSRCKAEADAQRRLKDVFAHAAPPPPSEGLLARLQGLPGGPGVLGGSRDDDETGSPFGGRMGDAEALFGALSPSVGRPGVRRPGPFGYVPGPHPSAHGPGLPGLPGRPAPATGFRIHEVGRQDADRSLWRGRRFAFAAASAVSFAAIALGASLPLESSSAGSRAGGQGGSTTPLRAPAPNGTQGTGATPGSGPGVGANAPTTAAAARAAEYERRRSSGTGSTRSEERTTSGLVPLAAPAPLGLASHPSRSVLYSAFPAFKVPPLIRPTGSALQLSSVPDAVAQATPSPTHLVAPSPGPGPQHAR